MPEANNLLPTEIKTPADVRFGFAIGEPLKLNLSHWDKEGLIPRRRTERKTWIYVAALNEHFFAAMAIVDAGYIATAFAYLYDRKTGFFIEEKTAKPFYFDHEFSPSLQTNWQLKDGNRHWEIYPTNEDYLNCQFQGDQWQLSIRLNIKSPGLNALCPSPGRPFNYTYKNVCLAVTARAQTNNNIWEHQDSGGCLDFSAGYPPRETVWNWASLVGKTADGELFGLNLVAHHNEGLENGLWFRNTILPAGKAYFEYEKPMEQHPTCITAPAVGLQLNFSPEGCRREKLNLLAIVSDFVQPFGTFRGSFEFAGKNISVAGVGVVEDHRAVW